MQVSPGGPACQEMVHPLQRWLGTAATATFDSLQVLPCAQQAPHRKVMVGAIGAQLKKRIKNRTKTRKKCVVSRSATGAFLCAAGAAPKSADTAVLVIYIYILMSHTKYYSIYNTIFLHLFIIDTQKDLAFVGFASLVFQIFV